MRLTIGLLPLLLLLSLGSCESSTEPEECAVASEKKHGLGLLPFAVLDLTDTPYQLAPEHGEITDVELVGDCLLIPVGHVHGCLDYSFNVIADSQAELRSDRGLYEQPIWILHGADRGPPCHEYYEEVLVVDLGPLRQRYREVGISTGVVPLRIQAVGGGSGPDILVAWSL